MDVDEARKFMIPYIGADEGVGLGPLNLLMWCGPIAVDMLTLAIFLCFSIHLDILSLK